MWPNCHLVHGKPRHSQSQGSVERCNQDVEVKLACWMRDNNSTKWSEALRFIQYSKNRCHHSGIGRTPYEAVFGIPPRAATTLAFPETITHHIETNQTESSDDEDVGRAEIERRRKIG